jgi:hypothetical protein
LLILLIVFGVLALLCAGVCGGCMYFGGQAAQQAGAYAEILPSMMNGLQLALDDQRVKDKLGEPVTPLTAFPSRVNSGEVKPVDEPFTFEISGPNGKAKVTGHATKVGSFWQLTTITVECSDGEKIEITPPADSPLELNFDSPTESSSP